MNDVFRFSVIRRDSFLGWLAFLLVLLPLLGSGEESAPSSHFVFDDRFEGDVIIHEVRVPREGEARYTYYETLGWRGKAAGYAGIQAHPRAPNFIFSIWDHPDHTAPIRAVHQGPGTEVEPFGGEGTGLKSWNFELGWEVDTWYTLVARCWPVGDHTHHGFWARSGKTDAWTHLVTMDVAAADAYFQGGTDAFIEDWLATGKEARTMHLRDGWKRRRDGDWYPFQEGRYSVNAWDLEKGKRSFRYRTAWNGGVDEDESGKFYFMVSGGKATRPETENPSTHSLPRSEESPKYEPIQVDKVTGKMGKGREIVVAWETVAATLPQFSFAIRVYDNPEGVGEPLAEVRAIDPGARKASLILPEAPAGKRLSIRLQCRDILDHEVDQLVNP